MSLSFSEFQAIVKQSGIKYFLHPEKPMMLFGACRGKNYYYNIISLELNGEFFQLRSLHNLYCPKDHPHLLPVLKLLGAINYKSRLVKFGWDPSDGEIMASADMWLMDNKLTVEQWERILQNFLSILDLNYQRLKQVLETGEDPGEEDVFSFLLQLLDEPDAPPGIQILRSIKENRVAGLNPFGDGKEDENDREDEDDD